MDLILSPNCPEKAENTLQLDHMRGRGPDERLEMAPNMQSRELLNVMDSIVAAVLYVHKNEHVRYVEPSQLVESKHSQYRLATRVG